MYNYSQFNFSLKRTTLLLIGGLLTSSFVVGQATYYVAETGNDANDGRSPDHPFRTVTRVNILRLQPGDSLLFRRGDSFGAGLVLQHSGTAQKPIVVGAYGTGQKPRLTGAISVTGWVQQGNGLWRATCAGCVSNPTGLFRNNNALPLGRYPNADAPNRGYLIIKSHRDNKLLESEQPFIDNWTGAEVVLRPAHWIIDRARVTKQQSHSLSLDNRSTYPLLDGWGFFLQNHLATLDQPGEWFYDANLKTFWLIDNQSNPNEHTLTATVIDYGLTITGAAHLRIEGLHLTQTRSEGLLATNVQSLTLSHNAITNMGENGLSILGTGHSIVVEQNRITDVNNNGLWVSNYRNVKVRGNTLHRIGIWPGRGKSGDGQYNGLHSEVKSDGIIELNRLDSIGYNGISFADSTMVRRNVVSNFCLVKGDGGGLYVWNGSQLPMRGIRVEANLISNGIGTPYGSPNGLNSGANGIFLDDCVRSDDSEGINLVGNTVFTCSGYGIYLHAATGIRAIANTAFNNRVCQFIMYDNGGRCAIRQNTVKYNRFVSRDAGQWVAGYLSHTDDLPLYGSIDSNQYARPVDDTFIIRAVYNKTTGDDLTLAQWQKRFGHDRATRVSPFRFTPYRIDSLNLTNRFGSALNSIADGWSVWSPDQSGRVVAAANGPLGQDGLRIDFQSPTGIEPTYLLASRPVGLVKKGDQFLLRFEGVSALPKKVEVFLRQREAPYADLSARHSLLIDSTLHQHEWGFTTTANDTTALLVFQVRDDGQPLWLRTIRIYESRLTPIEPDSLLKLVYNPTTKDSLIQLSGHYRDLDGKRYDNRFILPPFTSAVLLADTTRPAAPPLLPSADLSLQLIFSRRVMAVGELFSGSLCVTNASSNSVSMVTLQLNLPGGLAFYTGLGWRAESGQQNTVQEDKAPPNRSRLQMVLPVIAPHQVVTAIFWLQATEAGQWSCQSQISTSSLSDPDSTPGNGLANGEDDMAWGDVRVIE